MADQELSESETGDLLARIRGGEAAARNELLARHRPGLRNFISLRTDRALRGRIDASDIVQEALMESNRRLDEYLADSHGMPFRLWLRRVAFDRIVMIRRRHLGAQKRSVKRELRLPEASSAALGAQMLSAGSSPSERISKRELAAKVREAMAELSEPDQEILLLRTYEGFSHQEAAWILGIEVEAARQRLTRALLRLNRLLKKLGIDGAGP